MIKALKEFALIIFFVAVLTFIAILLDPTCAISSIM